MYRFSMMVAAVTVLTGASPVTAQTTATGVPPAQSRLTVSGNFGFQVSKQDVTRSTSFSLYQEEAQIEIVQNDIEGGGIFDIGANYRLRERLGVGIAYNYVRSEGDGTVTGSIPHPLVFDQFRSLSATAADLEHKEHATHLQATWHIPFTEEIDFTVSAGPSFFNISQEFIRRVTFSETPPFTSVNVDEVEVIGLRKNAVGFNIGVDATYKITSMFSAGVLARFTRGSADFDLNEGDRASVKAGGFQLAGGVRVRVPEFWSRFW